MNEGKEPTVQEEDNATDLFAVGDALSAAKKAGYEAEVVWSALHYMGDNPGCKISDAMNHGLLEWDV